MVGPGSLAGVLAVAVRSIGFVSKLLAEGIEEIGRGQGQAVTATGTRLQTTRLYAIVPHAPRSMSTPARDVYSDRS